MKSYTATGKKLPEPKSAEKPTRRFSKSSAESVSKKIAKPAEPESHPVAKPKDPRNERLYLLIKDPEDAATLTKIRQACDRNLGIQEVILVFKNNGEKQILKMPFKVEISDELKTELIKILGEENLKVK